MQARKTRETTAQATLHLMVLAAALILVCGLTVASQLTLLRAMNSQGLSLVEIGGYARMRVLRFLKPFFETRSNMDHAFLIGVSESGDALLYSVQSGRGPYSRLAHDQIDISTVGGRAVTSIHLNVRGLTALYAELSPDQRAIAVVGGLSGPADRMPVYGIHLFRLSGESKTLVATTEPEAPHSIGWSKDGNSIVYDTAERVWVYQLDTSTSSFLADGDHPTWSPDGAWIAYRRIDGTAALVSPDGSHSKRILGGAKIRAGLRWSPDSRYLLFSDASGIKVLDLADDQIAVVFVPIDQYNETRLRWVRDLPE